MSETLRHETATPPTTVGGVRFIGTATTLIRYRDITLLTDPNFVRRGQRISLGYGMWTKRLTDPALGIDGLPHLDAVVLSHLHGDHFDRVARRGLRHDVPVLTTPQAARWLGRWKFDAVQPLQTWQETVVRSGSTSVRVTSLPAVHARGVLGKLLPETMGSMLDFSYEGRHELRMYVTGDSLYGEHVAGIRRRFPDIDVALVHLGGTRVLGALVTMDGPQGADLLQDAQPALAIPIHYGDYPVFKAPLADFEAAVAKRPLVTSRITVLGLGDEQPLAASAHG